MICGDAELMQDMLMYTMFHHPNMIAGSGHLKPGAGMHDREV